MATTVLTRPLRATARIFTAPVSHVLDGLEDAGEQLSFYLRSLGWLWRTIKSYKTEVVRLIAEVDSPSLRAAADTLRSCSRASSATRRLRSRSDMASNAMLV